MKIETLRDRLDKAIAKVEKKENTIVKKTAQIEKKYQLLEKLGVHDPKSYGRFDFNDHTNKNDIYWTYCDISDLENDINRGHNEIEEIKKTITKYELQLAGELERERLFITEVPKILKTLEEQLIQTWDIWDKERREFLNKKYDELGYKNFVRQYTSTDYDLIHKSDDEIHSSNQIGAHSLVLDLYNRVKDITGEVTDWSNIVATQGTQGIAVLNGFVIGKEGRAKVESIAAGGYNIQKLHVRVLVKSFQATEKLGRAARNKCKKYLKD